MECAPGGGGLSWSARPEAADYRRVRARRRRIIVECAAGGGGFLAERALDPMQFVTIGGFSSVCAKSPKSALRGIGLIGLTFGCKGSGSLVL